MGGMEEDMKLKVALLVFLYLIHGFVFLTVWAVMRDDQTLTADSVAFSPRWFLVVLILGIVATVLSIVLTIRIFFKYGKFPYTDAAALKLSGIALRFKLWLLPFFALNLLICVGVFFVSFLPGMHALFLVLPISAVFAYIVLLPSAAYGVSLIRIMRQKGRITPIKSILCIILQFIFVIDFISYIFLYIKARKEFRT
jgi:hypothetical protein